MGLLVSLECQRSLRTPQPRAEELEEHDNEECGAHDPTLDAIFGLGAS